MTGGGRSRPIDGREPRPVSSAELREKLLPFRLRDFTPACPTPSRDAADTAESFRLIPFRGTNRRYAASPPIGPAQFDQLSNGVDDQIRLVELDPVPAP